MKRFQNLSLLTLLAASACTPLGAAIYKFAPDPVQEARYKLEDRPTAVLVENFRNPDLAASDAELLTRNLCEKLAAVTDDKDDKKKRFTHIIPFEEVLELRNRRPKEFGTMTIPQIGKAVGAEQIIYVDLQAGGVAPMSTGEVLQGKATGMVKVVDVASGDTLWPTETAEGYSVSGQTNPLQGQDSSTYNAVREELYDTMADNIAKLFYKYTLSGDDHPPSMTAE